MSDWDDGREPPKPSIGKLVERLSEQATRLVRAEIELAKTELKTKVAHAGIGIAMFVVAGVLALYGLGWLFYSAYEGIAVALAPWLAALVLGIAIFVVVAVLAMVGKSQLQRGMPPTPEKAIQSVKDDVSAIKGGASGTTKDGASA